MPLKSKQPSKKQVKNKNPKLTTPFHRRLSNVSNHKNNDFVDHSEDIDHSSGSSDTPRINMKNLLKTLESQSKQKLVKKQNKTIEEIKFNLQGVLLDRLKSLIRDQESEFEEIVSGFFTFKAQLEAKKQKLIDEVIQLQQFLQETLGQLENNLLTHVENFQVQSDSTIQKISSLNLRREKQRKPIDYDIN